MVLSSTKTPGPARSAAETSAERESRVRHEAAILAQAESDIDAGLGLGNDEMEAWLADLDRTDPIDEPSAGPVRGS